MPDGSRTGSVDAVLLAGGFGTRLRPLTYTRPKPLLNVGGRPMLEWMLDRLPPEVGRVIVAVNWGADALEAHFASSPRDLEFVVVREEQPLGTAGAVRNCQGHIQTDRFFVLNADIVSDVDLGAQLHQHEETGAEATIALKQVARKDVVHYGVAAVAPEDPRRITGFVEKPNDPREAPSALINAGAYLLGRRALRRIGPGMVSMEQAIFPAIVRDRGLWGVAFDGLWVDVGDPDRLRAAARALGDVNAAGALPAPAGNVIDSVLGARCTVHPSARVEGSVLGDDVTVHAGAVLVHCVVGDGQQVRGRHQDARLWDGPVPEGYPQQQVGNALAVP